MCHSFANEESEWDAFETLFGPYRRLANAPVTGRFFPGRDCSVVWRMHADGVRVFETFRWGVPHWKGARPIFNTRDDKLTGRFWRDDFARRRCLVPATRFAEWTGLKGARREQWFGVRGEGDAPLFAIAGVWREVHMKTRHADRRVWKVFTLVTTAPNEAVAPFHARMPAVLDSEDFACWLEGSEAEALDLARHAISQNRMRVFGPAGA